MHSQHIATIIANPEDDRPRLVFADFLEDNGEPERAEFIRVQCELAKIPACTLQDAARLGRSPAQHQRLLGIEPELREALRRRERELLDDAFGIITLMPTLPDLYPHSWSYGPNNPELRYGYRGPEGIGQARIDTEFRRGFVEQITCTWADWRAHADAIMRATPLREVTFTEIPYELIDTPNGPERVYLTGDGSPSRRWPGIKFNWPPPLATTWRNVDTDYFEADFEPVMS